MENSFGAQCHQAEMVETHFPALTPAACSTSRGEEGFPPCLSLWLCHCRKARSYRSPEAWSTKQKVHQQEREVSTLPFCSMHDPQAQHVNQCRGLHQAKPPAVGHNLLCMLGDKNCRVRCRFRFTKVCSTGWKTAWGAVTPTPCW